MDGNERDRLHAGRSRRDREKERQWRKRLADHRASGLSVRAFCRRDGLREAQFYWWQRELARRDQEAGKSGLLRQGRPSVGAARGDEAEAKAVVATRPAFAELRVRQDATARALSEESSAACDGAWWPVPIEVVLRNGRMLRVRRGFEADLLAAVVRVLEREGPTLGGESQALESGARALEAEAGPC
jgi:hypothetical protein